MKIPEFLRYLLSKHIGDRHARMVWDWLQSNSNTVIVDELEAAIRARRNWRV